MTEREREAGMASPWSIGSRWWLAALVLAACASPALTVSPPGPGVPKITGLVIEPARIESSCRADVVIVPHRAGGDVYRVQLEDAHGQTSNVAEARVDVLIRPFWRRAQCETPSGESAGDGRQASAPTQAVGTRRSEEGSR